MPQRYSDCELGHNYRAVTSRPRELAGQRGEALTNGTDRTVVDVLLYGALLVLSVLALLSDGTGPVPALGSEIGVLPAWHTIQEYRLVDAAIGEFERGYIMAEGLVTRQPWAGDVPVHVHRETAAGD